MGDYTALSKYPSLERDISFQVANSITYQQIIDAVRVALQDTQLETAILPLDFYQPDNKQTKNITIRVRLTANDKTLTGSEANAIIEAVIASVSAATNATVV